MCQCLGVKRANYYLKPYEPIMKPMIINWDIG